MLERGGVEDQLGPRLAHDAVEADAVAHVGEDGAARQVGMRIGDFEIDAVEVELAAVEQGDLGRVEAAYLSDQLAADRAAGAGHQDAAAGDQPPHGVAVEHGLRPAEEILDRHRADVELLGGAVAELDEARHPRHRHAEPVGGVDELADRRAGDVVAGQDQALRTLTGALERGDHLGDVVEGAQHVDAVNVAAHAAIAFGDHGDGAIELQLAAVGGADEEFGAVAGAGEQHRDRLRIVVRLQQAEAPVLDDAVEEAWCSDHEEEEEPVDDRNRARQRFGARQHEERRHEDEDDDGRRLGQGKQIVDRGVAPDAAIKVE